MARTIGILAQLPGELEYLIEPALKYGGNQFDDEVDDFLLQASDDELEELAAVAERYRVNRHHNLVDAFFDRYPITDYPESAKLYFLFGVIDAAGLPLSPDDWNTVERHIETLGLAGGFYIASKRMGAAMLLAELGVAARPAIPHLLNALHDEDLRVCVWAHYALAVIDGSIEQHAAAVREIFLGREAKDELDCFVDEVGSAANAALEKFQELRRS
jgi:hypothetical protein